MKHVAQPSSKPAQNQGIFGKIRNRLATCMVAGVATGAAMGCAPSVQPPATSLSAGLRHDIREDILKELQKRKICAPFGIELKRERVLRIGLSEHERNMVNLIPSHDATIQRMLLCSAEKLTNTGHVLELLKRDFRVIRFLDESMYSNASFMLQAAAIDQRALDYAHSSLFENPNFIIKIVLLNAKNIKYAFPYHLSNPKLFVKLMQIKPKALDHLPNYVASNSEFIERVGFLDPTAYLFSDVDVYKGEGKKILSSPIWRVKEYARMITDSKHLHNLQYFAPNVRSDVDFMLELMKIDTKAYHYRDYSIRGDEKLMRAYLQTLHKPTNSNLHSERLQPKEIDALMADLKSLNIEFPDRFSLSDLRTVIKNRKAFQKELDVEEAKQEKEKQEKRRLGWMWKKKKEKAPTGPKKPPITLQIAAKADWNAAFVNGITDDFIAKGVPILYFEANTKDEAFKIMDDLILLKQQVNNFIISGHGSQRRIALGAPDPRITKRRSSSRYYFDTYDGRALQKRRKLMVYNGRLIFQSCSVGEGAQIGNNIANTWHDSFPQSQLDASRVPTNIEYVVIAKNGTVTNVIFSTGEMSTYRIQPNAVRVCLAKKNKKYAHDNGVRKFIVAPADLKECHEKAAKEAAEKEAKEAAK